MTWKSFHNRGEILRSVTAAADTRRDGVLPMDVEGVSETFGDELSLLAALQLKWHTRLAGNVEKALVDQPLDLDAAVAAAWGETADKLPGLRLILDHYRAEPVDEDMARAMAKATAKEHIMLAATAGRSSVNDPGAVTVGAQLEEVARLHHRGVSTVPAPAPGAHARLTLLDRLKAVVAA